MALGPKVFTTSGTTVIRTGSAMVGGITLRNASAQTDNVVTVYDNTAASGPVLFSVGPLAAAPNGNNSTYFPILIRAATGVTVAITGTTPNIVGSVFID